PFGTTWWDRTYGYPKDFWNWYHQHYKEPGYGDGDKDSIREAYEEWVREGRPNVKNKKWNRRPPEPAEEPVEEPEPADENGEAKVCVPCRLQQLQQLPTTIKIGRAHV